MNKSFHTIKLGKIGKVLMCKRVLKHQTLPIGDIPFYKISTFGGQAETYVSKELYNDFREKYSFPKKGDILISAAGTLGKTVIYDGEPAYFQDSNIVWIDNDESIVLNSFLYYFYQTKPWVTTNGSTINRIYNDNLRNIKLSIPALPIQKSIAKVLSDLDAKIELNNRINRELEAMAKTLYDYWFVQFDFPNEQGKPYKSSGGKMVFNAELKREIPEGWEVDNLLKLSNLESGGTPSKKISDYWNGEIPFYTPSDYSNSLFVMETEDSISNTGLLNCSSKLYPKGTIFITARGTVGNVNVASKNMSLNQSCYAFITIEGIHYSFLYFSVKSQIKTLKAKSGGSVFNSVVTNDIKQAKLPIPPKKTIQSFTKICSLIFEKIFIISLENQQLTELRDWLLPMLMNGQVVSTSSTTDVKEDVVNLRLVAEPGGEYKTSSLA